MRKNVTYPIYQFHPKEGLLAFTSPSTMYRVLNIGSNCGNTGVTLDYFKTRRMVIKHMQGSQFDISPMKFIEKWSAIYSTYLNKIMSE